MLIINKYKMNVAITIMKKEKVKQLRIYIYIYFLIINSCVYTSIILIRFVVEGLNYQLGGGDNNGTGIEVQSLGRIDQQE